MRSLRPARVLFAASIIGLGVAGLVNGGLALVWQQIPLDHPPEQVTIAYVCALIELVTGAGLLLRPTVAPASRVLFPYLALWVLLLEIPVVVVSPLDPGAWGTLGEIAAFTAGGWCLFAAHAGRWTALHVPFAVGATGIRAARLLLILALPMLAEEVIVGAVTAQQSILQPWLNWLPFPNGWACLTGVGSIAACLAMVFGVLPRLATTLEAAMLGLITVAYWAPALHTGRTATTAFLISAAVAAGVWLVADTYRGAPWLSSSKTSRGITLD